VTVIYTKQFISYGHYTILQRERLLISKAKVEREIYFRLLQQPR
jgi:hypothetical protein